MTMEPLVEVVLCQNSDTFFFNDIILDFVIRSLELSLRVGLEIILRSFLFLSYESHSDRSAWLANRFLDNGQTLVESGAHHHLCRVLHFSIFSITCLHGGDGGSKFLFSRIDTSSSSAFDLDFGQIVVLFFVVAIVGFK